MPKIQVSYYSPELVRSMIVQPPEIHFSVQSTKFSDVYALGWVNCFKIKTGKPLSRSLSSALTVPILSLIRTSFNGLNERERVSLSSDRNSFPDLFHHCHLINSSSRLFDFLVGKFRSFMYDLIAGSPPFHQEEVDSILWRIGSGQTTSLQDINCNARLKVWFWKMNWYIYVLIHQLK